ncbi:MAG: hypothetical protein AAF804_14085, partial [Bacteroidota bacterium]
DEISHLYRLLKAFWEVEGLQADPLLQRSLRLRQLSERRLNRLYQIERKSAQKFLDQQPLNQEQYYKYELAWASLDNEHFGRQQLRTVDQGLAKKLHALDVYYLSLLLRESCEALNRQHILNTHYEIPLLPALVKLLEAEAHSYRQVPVIEVYYQIYWSLQETASKKEYESLIASLRNYRDTFTLAETRAMYKYAQNFCIRQINRGHTAYDRQLFELFQELLAEGIILSQDNLSHTDYKNITTIGLRVKELSWVESFLEQYKQNIVPAFRDNVYAYCRAALEVEKGNRPQAIRLLQFISHTDVHYQISARQLLLKIYYHEQDLEAVLYTLDAFRHFLQRNRELPSSRKKQHQRFLTIFRPICLLQERLDTYTQAEARRRITKLRQKLTASEALPNRAWLLEQLEEMEQSIA